MREYRYTIEKWDDETGWKEIACFYDIVRQVKYFDWLKENGEKDIEMTSEILERED